MGDPTEEMMGLGGYIPQAAPQQPAGAQPSTQGTWAQFLADPVNRSGLLSFGLQALTGGWGNGTQQMGAAIGAGAQGMAGTAKSIQEQSISNRDFAAKEHEGEANRASHEKIAQIGADSRMEVAQTRSEAMLERAKLIRGPQGDKEMKIYADQYKSSHANLLKAAGDPLNKFLYGKGPADIHVLAEAAAKDALQGARDATGVRSQGSALPSDSASGDGVTDKSLGAGQSPAVAGKAPNATSVKPFNDYLATPGVKAQLDSDPKFRQAVRDRYPEYIPYLDGLYGRQDFEASKKRK